MTRAWIVALVVAGCVDVAEERAARDLRVGQAEAGGARVEVAAGLAAVRAFTPGELVLWAGAPAIEATLTAGAPTGWSIVVRNVLPDAVLEARGGAGEPLAAVLEEQRLPTEKRWRIASTSSSSVNVRVASPADGSMEPFRFGAFADVQEAIDGVDEIFARMALDPSLRFVLASGDLTANGGRDEFERFQRELEALPVPCFATLGNHELEFSDTVWHEYFGRGSYTFVHRGLQLTALDSASATLAPAVQDRLTGWLAEGENRFHVVMMHIPPLDPIGTRNGGFASRPEAHALVARLARAKVDVAIYGHLHSFYAYEHAGVPAFITGGGGAIPERFDGIGRHYLAIDVDPATQRFETSVVRVD